MVLATSKLSDDFKTTIPKEIIKKCNIDKDYIHYVEFFDIIYNLDIGVDVYLIIDESDWSINLIESLLVQYLEYY